MLTWILNWRLKRRLKRVLRQPEALDRLPTVLKELGYKEYTDSDDPSNRVFFGPNGARVQIKQSTDGSSG